MRQAVDCFGIQKVPFQEVVAKMTTFLQSKNTALRKESMLLMGTFYSWLRTKGTPRMFKYKYQARYNPPAASHSRHPPPPHPHRRLVSDG
jgi:hypothetical protein